MPRRVCIVGSGSIASNPRLLKEADALQAEGYEVTVVVCDYTEALRHADDEITRGAPWRSIRVPRPRAGRSVSWMAGLSARLMTMTGQHVPAMLAAEAYGGPATALRRAAIKQPADLYIAHYIPSLPAAFAAARLHGAMLGFDAEDFHSGEGAGGPSDNRRMAMVRRIEEAILPTCAYMTASSPMIGRAYAERYGIALPTTVRNVFPLDMAPPESAAPSPSSSAGRLRAYWFSQTIGLDRGLQAFLQAMARARADVTLEIRGSNRWRHGDSLIDMARGLGIGEKVRLLDLAPPQEMVRLAAAYDLGLSLETDVTESRRLCLTNKTFTYLLAGIPAMLSDTPAQQELAAELGQAACLVSLSRPEQIAAELDKLAASPSLLANAKATASRLARQRYNWDNEKRSMLEAVAAAFANRDEKCPR